MIRQADLVLLLACVLALGCGQSAAPTATVQGSVSVDGEAIQEGMISFSPLEADVGTGASAEIRNGQYQAQGVPLGSLLVRFQAIKETGKTIKDEVEGDVRETVDLIPPKYREGIPLTVSESTESHDFELKSR